VGGDGLELDVEVAPRAHALLTTPAATKLYRSGSAQAAIQQTLRVAAGARLEWLPQETIAFSAAQVDVLTRVELERGARWLGWEILCLGRPASGEAFESGHLRQRIELWCEGRLRYCERGSYRAGSAVLSQPWGLAGQPVIGSLLCAGCDLSQHLAELRAATGESAAVSCMEDVCVVRYLGPSTEQAKKCFVRAWEVLRPHVFARQAEPPRIWAT
jgi:urease accessory protein